jgi:hypothetical protein
MFYLCESEDREQTFHPDSNEVGSTGKQNLKSACWHLKKMDSKYLDFFREKVADQ